MNRKTFWLIIISLFVLLLFLFPYYNIRNEIFLDNNTFSSIGSYISGIVSVLNLCVFIYLTMLISKYDKVKNLKEIHTQKIIIQSQFRQTELDKLIEIIEKPFDTDGISSREKSMFRIAKASSVLNSFLNQKQYLFTIIKDEKYRNLGSVVIETFEEMLMILEENKPEMITELENLFLRYEKQKNELIHSLQAFILIELEK